MHKVLFALTAVASLSATTLSATADDFSATLSNYYETAIAHWANDPALISAIEAPAI